MKELDLVKTKSNTADRICKGVKDTECEQERRAMVLTADLEVLELHEEEVQKSQQNS